MNKLLKFILSIVSTPRTLDDELKEDMKACTPTGNPGTGYTPRIEFNGIIPVSQLKPNDVIILSMRDSVGSLSNETMESIKAHVKTRLEKAGINNAVLLLNKMDMRIVSVLDAE